MPDSANSSPYDDSTRAELHRFVPTSARTLLDVGCHRGAFGQAMKQHGLQEVWGVEPDPENAAIASTRLDRVLVGHFGSVDLPDSFFDVITFNDVLEHIPDPGAALRVAAGKLKPGGVLVASIPNLRHIDNLLHILRDKDFRYETQGVRDETHLRFYTQKSIPRLFELNGFTIRSLEGINEYWWSPSLARRLAFRFFPRYLADTRYIQFAVVAQPKRLPD